MACGMTDIEHLRACWPTIYINGETRQISAWCGWSFDEALAKMLAMRERGEVNGDQPVGLDGIPAIGQNGLPIYFWDKPAGAHGLLPVDDPRLRLIGITRAHSDGRRVIYQGRRPLEVYRLAKREGYSLRGYSLDWRGPDPAPMPQLVLPLGVELDIE
jgi:hypothetical protein